MNRLSESSIETGLNERALQFTLARIMSLLVHVIRVLDLFESALKAILGWQMGL